jgi:hypothetical protein
MLPTFGETLKSLLNVLADEKSNMYVRTNCIQPIRRLIPFLDFAFPAHLHDIGTEFWHKFANLERNRYKVIRTETPISELDFRGFPLKCDGRGSYSIGIQEQIIFPEINLDAVKRTQGMNITFVTSAKSDQECVELLTQLGFPFKTE